MNQSILVGYDPHCCMFKRNRKGGIYYQLQFQLPGGVRRTISLGKNKKEAKFKHFLKEKHLRELQYDEADLEKMPEKFRMLFSRLLLSLQDALDQCLKATEAERKTKTKYSLPS